MSHLMSIKGDRDYEFFLRVRKGLVLFRRAAKVYQIPTLLCRVSCKGPGLYLNKKLAMVWAYMMRHRRGNSEVAAFYLDKSAWAIGKKKKFLLAEL